jgi:pimeloyl-ACP methyl ester carboxylesterase
VPRATIGGYEMHYEASGKGFPVAFVYGGFGGMVSTLLPREHPWRGDFSRHYTVVTYDRRSSGRSAYPENGYSLENFAGDLGELLRHLGIERSHLIGSSAGGPIAITYALMYPEAVEALALVNTSPCLVPEGAPAERIRARVRLLETEGPEAAYEARREAGPVGLDLFFANVRNVDPAMLDGLREVHKQVQARIRESTREQRVAWYAGETRNYSAYLGVDLTPRLHDLRMPTFIIHGDADSIVPVSGAYALKDHIHQADLNILRGAEHGLMAGNEEAPRAILDFLRRIDAAAGGG